MPDCPVRSRSTRQHERRILIGAPGKMRFREKPRRTVTFLWRSLVFAQRRVRVWPCHPEAWPLATQSENRGIFQVASINIRHSHCLADGRGPPSYRNEISPVSRLRRRRHCAAPFPARPNRHTPGSVQPVRGFVSLRQADTRAATPMGQLTGLPFIASQLRGTTSQLLVT